MDAQRRLVRVVLVAVGQAELGGHGEVHLVGGDGEFAADGAPHLHVDLRPVERRLVGDLHVVDAGFVQHLAHHVLGLFPKLRFIDVFLAQPFRRGGAEAHLIFFEAEDFEILQIHVVHRAELVGELLLGAIDVRVVHVERAHAHEAEQLAALLVAIASAVFREAQRQIAVTVRLSRKDAVMMRTVHGFEVIALRLAQLFQFRTQRGQLVESGRHGLRRNASFDGLFNQLKFFGFQNGRHAGENSVTRRAKELQIFQRIRCGLTIRAFS